MHCRIGFKLTVVWLMNLFFALGNVHASSQAQAQAQVQCQCAENQQQMTLCITRALAAEENKLQQIYDQLMQEAQAEDKALGWPEPHKKAVLLQKAQQAWAVFRDYACQFEHFDSLNGSAYADYLNRCKIKYTAKRQADLHWFLQNP